MFAEGAGYKAAAHALGVPEQTARDWARSWRSGAWAAGRTCGTRYPRETKGRAVADLARGDEPAEVMERYRIAHRKTLRKWRGEAGKAEDRSVENGAR